MTKKIKSYTSFFFLGIGLLELMLSIAIIAGIVVMGIRYYQAANASQKNEYCQQYGCFCASCNEKFP